MHTKILELNGYEIHIPAVKSGEEPTIQVRRNGEVVKDWPFYAVSLEEVKNAIRTAKEWIRANGKEL